MSSPTPTPPLTQLQKLAALQRKAVTSWFDSEESDNDDDVVVQPKKSTKAKAATGKPLAVKMKADVQASANLENISAKHFHGAAISESELDEEEIVPISLKSKGKKKARITPPPPSLPACKKFGPSDLPTLNILPHTRPAPRTPLQMISHDHPVYNGLRTRIPEAPTIAPSFPSAPVQAPAPAAPGDEYASMPPAVRDIAHALIPSLKGQPDSFLPPGIVKLAWTTHLEAQKSMYEQAMSRFLNPHGRHEKKYYPNMDSPSNDPY
ncbi:hypothetical protein SERLA73DRAFT_69560 [Serpula lacrymans var. lacrymans S7.3]|uniref:Uncharacterized protein n=2 Tax=Serpula lacrymans var. lacrymans TaxID=341189 RepID=F8PJ95_SERL3|nr:uncharacterized protein SERLADRAFT_433560 [Serpula lacrymans var. lacrymans S7.9]EGO03720.1 hypothetical protein SERLA73DRAFT_69560 [Serpula lacrymans var. lacrymans S7.3]EGO29584.1 hypothetical protein SERLADRAFT_433560 [Serpula lacrymans var. lacrymans S7.9]